MYQPLSTAPLYIIKIKVDGTPLGFSMQQAPIISYTSFCKPHYTCTQQVIIIIIIIITVRSIKVGIIFAMLILVYPVGEIWHRVGL